MKATRPFFFCSFSFKSSTRLKNSTVSSSVNRRSSCRYGGDSLIALSGAGCARALDEEDLLAAHLALAGFGGRELAEDVELGRGREVEQSLKLRHEMHLAAAFEDVGAFARGVGRDTVEVGASLLELGEVLHGLHRPLRTEQALNVQAPQRWRVVPMTMLIGPNIADRVGGGVRMAVGVTVEAGHALRGLQAAAVFDGVELLLGKRRDQQPQSFELLGIEDVLEQFVEVAERHQFPLRDVTQIRPRRQIDRRRELGQEA